ncbi:unnamed protein product [Aureobasidium pullulans]|nr:unnamed protein product [Aureobasidium pullulans]
MADVDTESPAQRAARLRREKRNAKIQTEGSDRLARITQLSGRPAPAPEEPSMVQTPTKPAQATSPMTPQHASIEDPDEPTRSLSTATAAVTIPATRPAR